MILPPQDWIQRQDAKERALVEAKLDYMGGSVTTIRTPPMKKISLEINPFYKY